MKITVYTMGYNEQVFLQYMIDHYRTRFPECNIVFNDNESTDNTRQIALDNGCQVLDFRTNNVVDDIKITQLKNNCWFSATTDWVLVCDVDELLDINEQDLITEANAGTTIIRSCGWNMVNHQNNYDFAGITQGTRVPQYDKNYLFNKSQVPSMNYTPGCHSASPHGNVKFSQKVYPLWHYKCINPDYLVERFKITASRLSEVNKRAGMGTYWLNQTDESIRAGYYNGLAGATKVK